MNISPPFFHIKKEQGYTTHLFYASIPLMCYGWYKNGLLPYLEKDSTLISIVTPILFFLVGFFIGLLVDYLRCLHHKEKVHWDNTAIYGLFISMTMPITINLIIYALLLFVFLLFFRYLEEKLPKVPISTFLFTETLLLLLCVFLQMPYENISEQNQIYFYTTLDIFFGRNVGGIASTSIFWLLIAYLFLFFEDYYKKEIPITVLITYVISAITFELFLPTGNILTLILNPAMLFATIFFAADISSSPYTEHGKICYAIMIGFLGFLSVRLLHPVNGVYYIIAFLSIFTPWIDEITYKISKKKKKFCRTTKKEKSNLDIQKIILPKIVQEKEKTETKETQKIKI